MRTLRIILVAVYLFLLTAMFGLPLWGMLRGGLDWATLGVWLVVGCVFVGTQAVLLLVPGRASMFAPVRPRRLVAPAIAAGLVMAGVSLGLIIALHELWETSGAWASYLLLLVLGLWAAWACIFYVYCSGLDRFAAVRRMVLAMLAGSLLQLMATVPSHLVVSRRPECMAGMGTALGIFLAITGMFWAFGPGIVLLFWAETRKRLPGCCPGCGYELRGLSQLRCPECGRAFTFAEIGATPQEMDYVG